MSATFEMNTFVSNGGSWDEEGLVEGLDRKGFTPNKCSSELIANSISAQATKIVFKNGQKIKIMDDGLGMDRNQIQDMFKMMKANNKHKTSMGVSGFGGKEALYQLSKKNNRTPTKVTIHSHQKDGEYLKAICPWDEIIKEKIYTGKIQFSIMTPEEIDDFHEDRKGWEFENGTTILFNYTDSLWNLFETQFDEKRRQHEIEPDDRWDMIFGQTNTAIILDKTDGTSEKILSKYNYFGGDDIDYYTGKNVEYIEHYIDEQNHDRFIWLTEDNRTMEILPHGNRGYKNDPMPIRLHQSWKKYGTFKITNGMRKCKEIFDSSNPRILDNATLHLNNYDEQYFGCMSVENVKEYLRRSPLVRNEQLIVRLNLDMSSTTSRGNASSIIKQIYHQTEIKYLTESTQDNRMDIAMGIQENKNQHEKRFPKDSKPLERLVIHLKNENIRKINEYFEEVTSKYENKKYQEMQQKLLEKKLALEKERQEKEKLEKEKLEKGKLEKEKLEKERLEKERLEKERLEKEKSEDEESEEDEKAVEEESEEDEESEDEEESETDSDDESVAHVNSLAEEILQIKKELTNTIISKINSTQELEELKKLKRVIDSM